MTDLQQFNLFWLCHAMSAPQDSLARYYFDARTKKFFCSKQGTGELEETGLFNMIDLAMPEVESAELKGRLGTIDSEASEIVEIPRLNVQDKVSVQLSFLSNFAGVIREEDLRLAVERQRDVSGFVLDIVLGNSKILEPMQPYWDDFKLKTIQYYLEKFTGLIGITVRLF